MSAPLRLRSLRQTAAVFAALAVVAGLTVGLPGAEAAPTTISLGTTHVAEGVDFASTEFGDAWDFTQVTDLEMSKGLGYLRMSNASISGGLFTATAETLGSVMPLRSWDPGAIPWGRDGALHPINTSKYTHIAFRMKTSLSAPLVGGQVNWYDCGQTKASCRGGARFTAQPGWATYIVELENFAPWGHPVEWEGMIRGLQIAVAPAPTTVSFDWIRLYQPGANVTITVSDDSPGSVPKVYWDRDTQQSNNTAGNPNWGLLGPAPNGQIVFPAAAFPPGGYYFFVDDNSTISPHTPRLTVDKRPRVVIVDPDQAGGTDYAQVARGNQWDMSQPGDVARYTNATGTVSGGLLVGTNAPPNKSDSQIGLPLAGTINGTRFHRATVRVYYAGDFSLAGGVGGGMNARFVWGVGPGQFRVADDPVVRPGWNTITVDLADLTAADIIGSHGPDWTGGHMDMLRFDPHEDSGTRQFKIDYIKLTEDDRGLGTTNIRFRDQGWEAGSTARIYADNNRSGFNGSLIGVVGVTAGLNTFRWTPTPFYYGTRWIHISITDPSGTTSRAYSTGPVRMQAPSSGVSPTGRFDRVIDAPAGMMVRGWAYDGDGGTSSTVKIFVDGQLAGTRVANFSRPDVPVRFGVPDATAGFDRVVPVSPGVHDICVIIVNQNSGADRHLGCKTVNRRSNPVGSLLGINRHSNAVRMVGWAVDPNSADPVRIRVVVDGVITSTFFADIPRSPSPWVGAKYGNDLGFDKWVGVGPGPSRVCVWALNIDIGTHTRLSCRTL